MKAKGKDNVWSIDNEVAEEAELKKRGIQRRRRGKGKSGKRVKKVVKTDNVLVSGSMLMELETVLQTQVMLCLIQVYNLIISSVCLFL